ncbi:MAG: ATP phosphoribosyltransferase [Elusimicrobia bacterium]|nr:ATP phosphoribosyltransferase [Elusimicrobiota bacterium]MBD3412167.1 ATP phosphoribosyltransferase [Elusimicrobiota bacterium]
MKKLKLALPKGSLQESTFNLFERAGIKLRVSSRSYFPICDDEELDVMLVRSQEIATYVEDGVFDAGITGFDWITECGADVQEVAELIYAKAGFRPVRWVCAVPNSSPIKTVNDLKNKRIATELVNVVTKYLAAKKIKAEVVFSWGATEAKAPALVDAIVELTETGSSLKANQLRIIEELMSSTTRLIANRKVWKNNAWKKKKISDLELLLKGALASEGMVGIKMNIPENKIQRILQILPALKRPTIAKLTLPNWVALEVIIEERILKNIIPDLKAAGAEGIIEYPLNKVIY